MILGGLGMEREALLPSLQRLGALLDDTASLCEAGPLRWVTASTTTAWLPPTTAVAPFRPRPPMGGGVL